MGECRHHGCWQIQYESHCAPCDAVMTAAVAGLAGGTFNTDTDLLL